MKKILITLMGCIFCLCFFVSAIFAQAPTEQITITTYYPSPFGSYRDLSWGNMPQSRGMLRADEGASIELGGQGVAPYIDFSNDMATDFDVRLRLIGDDVLAVQGGSLRLSAWELDVDSAATNDPLNGVAPYGVEPRFRNNQDMP
jgi:hypothetical protein